MYKPLKSNKPVTALKIEYKLKTKQRKEKQTKISNKPSPLRLCEGLLKNTKMDRQEKITYYCALFEKAYGEQPAGDLSTFTEDEINENINELQELLK